jgi:hypothetical protein
MADKPSQHEKYSLEILPLIFHHETDKFMSMISRDGVKFLEFWWDRAGLEVDESKRSSPEGIQFEIKSYSDGREIVVVKMPLPRKVGEAYFLGMVTRPLKRSLFSWKNLARVFVLTRANADNADRQTKLAELTRSARYVAIGKGPKPTQKAFLETIIDLLDRKK